MGDTTTDLRVGRTEVLLGAARTGCQSAWRVVFERYERMLHGHVNVLRAEFNTRFDIEEVVLVTFERAWSQLDTFAYEGEGSFRRWLCTIARNHCLNERRQHGRQGSTRADTAFLAARPDERAAEEERTRPERMTLYEAMAGLDDETRDILIMYAHEGFKSPQIAGVLGCTPETAAERLERAIARLERRMGGRKDER